MRMTFVRLLAVLALASAPLIGGTIGAAADSSSAPKVAISEQAQFIGFSCSFGCGSTIIAQVRVSCDGGGFAGLSVQVNQALTTVTQGFGFANVVCDGSKHLVGVSVVGFSPFFGGGYQLGDAFAIATACGGFTSFACTTDTRNIKIVL